jgi:catechol 2,3-dioxygenase-like lactoylglutathione lyase family enzyme
MAHINGIDHVQIATPLGADDAARAFYTGVLGLPEIPKPAYLSANGGAWFACGALQIHIGGEAEFIPARKAHPALLVVGFADYVSLLTSRGVEVKAEPAVAGRQRAGIVDPFGNRIELIEQLS